MFSHMFETPIVLADVDVHSIIVTLVTLSPDFMFPSTLPITVGLVTIANNNNDNYAIIAYLLIISYLIAIVSYLIILPTSCELGTGALHRYDQVKASGSLFGCRHATHLPHQCTNHFIGPPLNLFLEILLE